MDRTESIKAFLTAMANQDNRCTAFPYFYVIRTKVWDQAPIDNCDEVRFFWQDNAYDSLEEIREICESDGVDFEKEKMRVQEFGVRARWDKRGMFLTETDAKEHLRRNHYHYSPDAHDYIEHAWRAPELEQFLTDLFQHFEVERVKG